MEKDPRWFDPTGMKVQHVRTGEVCTINYIDSYGGARLSNGLHADIHRVREPWEQSGKRWKYVDTPKTTNHIDDYEIC
jgi:hypothetical protein